MREEEKAVNTLVGFITSAIKEMTKNLSYDRSIIARITNITVDNQYEVSYGGATYSPIPINDHEYAVGDRVLVTFLQGNMSNSILIGKVVD